MRIGQHHPDRAGNAHRSNPSSHRRRSAACRRARRNRLLFEALEPRNLLATDLVAFAQDLALNDVKLYGSNWCHNCVEQKDLFEDGAQFLPYVNLYNADGTRNNEGQGITNIPVWEFPDGNGGTEQIAGKLTLEQIAAESGIALPDSDTPWVKPIDEVVQVLAGSPLHMPLDGYDPNGDALDYEVTVEDANGDPTNLLSAEVLEGNQSMRVNILSHAGGFTMDLGQLVFELFEQRAPRPTERLVELTNSGHYDDTYYHRLEPGFVLQGGGATPTQGGSSTLGNFDDQFHVDLQHNRDGTISYAKGGDDTNDAQYFVTLGPARHLDSNHSVAGQLVEGFDLLRDVQEEPVVALGSFNSPEFAKQIGVLAAFEGIEEQTEIFTDTENAVVMLKADPAAVGQQFSVTVTASDSANNQTTVAFDVTVADDIPENGGANAGPFLGDIGPVVTPRNTPAQIQLSSTDVEGDPVFYDAANAGSVDYQLAVSNETGLVTVTPPNNFVGQMEVLVGVAALNGSDTADTFDQQVVTIEVIGPPTLDLLPGSDSNVDNDDVTNVSSMTFEVSEVVAGAQVDVLLGDTVIGQGTANSSINIAADNLSDGVYGLSARQTFGGVESARSVTLKVTVDTVAPAAFTSTPPTKATVGVALEYDAANPEEGTPGLYSLVGAPDGVSIHADTGVMTWTPTQDQVDTHAFQVKATDIAGNSTTQNISIEVFAPRVRIRLDTADLQGNPITRIQPGGDFLLQGFLLDVRHISIAEGVFAAYMDIAYDPSFVSTNANGPGDVTFGNDYPNDPSGDFAALGLVDEIGSFSSSIFEPLDELEHLQFSIPMTAVNAGETTFLSSPADGLGHEVLVYRTGHVDEAELVVPPEEVVYLGTTLVIGDGLIARDDIFNVDEDSSNNVLDVINNQQGQDENPQGGTITIISVGATSNGGAVSISDGELLSYTPASDVFGEDTFTYTISNGQSTSTATVTVQLFPLNDSPTAVDDTATVGQDSQDNSLFVLGNDTFAPDQGETLQVVGVVDPSNGGTVTIAPNGTHLVYTPPAGFVGQETINYTIGDGNGGTANATVTVTVEEGTKPTAGDDAATVDEDSAANAIDVLVNDSPAVDGQPLSVANVTQPLTGGTVAIGTGGANVLYTPAPDFFGTDTFTYTVAEADGGNSIATVTVTITGRNDPPVANDDELNVTKNSQNNRLNVQANDTDLPDAGETFTITGVTLDTADQGSTWSISDDDQSILYTPATGFVGQEKFTYTVNDRNDGSGLTDQATVTVNVAESTVSGRITSVGTQTPIRGLQLRLVRTDGQDGPADSSHQTDDSGSYQFAATPGAYMVEADPPFLTPIETEVQVESGGNAAATPSTVGREARFIGIADFRADAPGQSLLSPQNAILAAVTPGVAQAAGEGEHDSGQNLGEQHWYSIEAGWSDYLDVQVQLSNDGSQITLIADAIDGHQYRVTISATDAQLVKFLGREGDAYLIRLTVDPASLDWQHVDEHLGEECTEESDSCSIEGEGEATDAIVATPSETVLATPRIDVTPTDAALDAPPLVQQDAEGESAAAAEPTVTMPVISVPEPVSFQTIDLGISETVTETAESIDSPAFADPGLGTVDAPGDSMVVQADDRAPSADELTTTEAVDAVLTETTHGDESVERDLVLIASQSEADEFAQAVDWLLASDLG